jgi:hypothetical protein
MRDKKHRQRRSPQKLLIKKTVSLNKIFQKGIGIDLKRPVAEHGIWKQWRRIPVFNQLSCLIILLKLWKH